MRGAIELNEGGPSGKGLGDSGVLLRGASSVMMIVWERCCHNGSCETTTTADRIHSDARNPGCDDTVVGSALLWQEPGSSCVAQARQVHVASGLFANIDAGLP